MFEKARSSAEVVGVTVGGRGAGSPLAAPSILVKVASCSAPANCRPKG